MRERRTVLFDLVPVISGTVSFALFVLAFLDFVYLFIDVDIWNFEDLLAVWIVATVISLVGIIVTIVRKNKRKSKVLWVIGLICGIISLLPNLNLLADPFIEYAKDCIEAKRIYQQYRDDFRVFEEILEDDIKSRNEKSGHYYITEDESGESIIINTGWNEVLELSPAQKESFENVMIAKRSLWIRRCDEIYIDENEIVFHDYECTENQLLHSFDGKRTYGIMGCDEYEKDTVKIEIADDWYMYRRKSYGFLKYIL